MVVKKTNVAVPKVQRADKGDIHHRKITPGLKGSWREEDIANT
jgi:hypothetical protein